MTISTSEPFELVMMDFLTVSSSCSRFRYASVFKDHFTKFALVVSTKDQTATTAAKLFWEHGVQPYGCLRCLHLYQGPNFES